MLLFYLRSLTTLLMILLLLLLQILPLLGLLCDQLILVLFVLPVGLRIS